MRGISTPTFHLKIEEDADTGLFRVKPESLLTSRDIGGRIAESPLKTSYKDIVGLGTALYRFLFSGRIEALFRAERDRYCNAGDTSAPGLRLLLDFRIDPERLNSLIDLPWELLRDHDGWLMLDPKLSIARTFNMIRPSDTLEPEQGVRPPLRVMFAYAEPPDKKPVHARESLELASKTLENAYELCKTNMLPNVTPGRLKSEVKQGFHIVHVLGHGSIESQGMLHLEQGEAPVSDILSARELAESVEESKIRPRLVVLTVCHSGRSGAFGILGFGAKLLDVGVDAVVTMQAELITDEARDFVSAFYDSLAKVPSVDVAVRAGRQALIKSWSPKEAGKYIQVSLEKYRENSTLVRDRRIRIPAPDTNGENIVLLPAWSVPALFLRGDGWLGLDLPYSPYRWPGDGKEMIYVEEGRFYIDKFPVTREEYRRFAEETHRPKPQWRSTYPESLADRFRGHFKMTKAIIKSWEPNLPATNVTIEDSQAYASWAGKHMPTPDEWRTAALSGIADKSAPYPWGTKLGDRVCNTREQGFRQLLPVFVSEEVFRSCNGSGVCDIVGNASEWTVDEHGHAALCGGSFKDWGEECTVQTRHQVTNPYLSNETIGFRCAATLTEWMDVDQREVS